MAAEVPPPAPPIRRDDVIARSELVLQKLAVLREHLLWAELPTGLDALERYAQAIATFVPPLAPVP